MNNDERKAHKAHLASLRAAKSFKNRGLVRIDVLPDTREALNVYKEVQQLGTQDAAIKKLLGIDEIV